MIITPIIDVAISLAISVPILPGNPEMGEYWSGLQSHSTCTVHKMGLLPALNWNSPTMFSFYFNMVATPPLFLFISCFGVPEPRIELGAALQKHDALPVGYVGTFLGYVATLSIL